MDHRVGLDHGVGVDPRARRVDDGDPGEHVRLVDPVAERGGRAGQLDSRVHALCLHRIVSLVHRDAVAVFHEERDRVCQVELALRVVRRQPVEHRPQPICPEHVDRRVHLSHGALRLGRVAVLDDRRKSPVGASHDAAVLLRVVGLEREDRRSGASGAMCFDQLPENLGGEERRVAGEDEHVVRGAVECRARAAHRVSGAERLLLDREREAVEGRGRGGSGNHDERVDTDRARRADDPVHHPAAEDRVQVLRHVRAHAGAEAGRHDDGAECPLTIRRHGSWGARIRTWDHGTKTRCLTTWPRPRASVILPRVA